MAVKCFWIEPTGWQKRWLRRYSRVRPFCVEMPSVHDARAQVEDHENRLLYPPSAHDYAEDSRWPTHCECGYEFTIDDTWQVVIDPIYRRGDTGEEMGLREAPAGAMWDANWMPYTLRGEDGLVIVVRVPGGHEWLVESRASNCDRTAPHRCWCRHGTPPELTVDKSCDTCTAGAGSLLTPDESWHGFLRQGWLVECDEQVPA